MPIVILTFKLRSILQNQNKCSFSHQHCILVCQVWLRRSQRLNISLMRSIVFTDLFPYMYVVTLSLTSNINKVYPLTFVNMSAKFDKEEHNYWFSIVFPNWFKYNYVRSELDLWLPKSIGIILMSLTSNTIRVISS